MYMTIDGRHVRKKSVKTVNALKASRCALLTNNNYSILICVYRVQRINYHTSYSYTWNPNENFKITIELLYILP